MINGDRLVEMVECYLLYLLRGEGDLLLSNSISSCVVVIKSSAILFMKIPDKNCKMLNVAVAAGDDGKLQMHLLNTSTFRYFWTDLTADSTSNNVLNTSILLNKPFCALFISQLYIFGDLMWVETWLVQLLCSIYSLWVQGMHTEVLRELIIANN